MSFFFKQVQEVQLRKDQELLNHQLQRAVLGRSGLNTKADIKSGVGHKTRIVKQPVDTNAWHKILSKEIAKHRKVRRRLGSCRAQKLSRSHRRGYSTPVFLTLSLLSLSLSRLAGASQAEAIDRREEGGQRRVDGAARFFTRFTRGGP